MTSRMLGLLFALALAAPAAAAGPKALIGTWEAARSPDDERLYVHGSPRRPLSEYVFPEDVYNTRKIESIFSYIQKYCFQGHTHVPGIFTESLPEDLYQFHAPDDRVPFEMGRAAMARVLRMGLPASRCRGCMACERPAQRLQNKNRPTTRL